MPFWVPLAFELAKGALTLITEAVGADSKQLDELGDRFDNLMSVGEEELRDAREASKTAAGYTEERRDAAVARIKAARMIARVIVTDPPENP